MNDLEKLELAIETLENAKLAINALGESQKAQGMGLLGKHFVWPVTVRRIDRALEILKQKDPRPQPTWVDQPVEKEKKTHE